MNINIREKECLQEAVGQGARERVRQPESIHSTSEMVRTLDAVYEAMTEAGFGEKDRFGVRIALEEALVNAIKHGHRGDTAKEVRIRYQVTTQWVVVVIRDQGSGFDPGKIPDPIAPEYLDRPSGRGVLLMRHYMTWVRYNRRGNGVTLCKRRSF